MTPAAPAERLASGDAGLNRRAWTLVEELMREDGERYGVRARTLGNGALVVDAGVEAPGGYDAGWLMSRICMADLADIEGAYLTLGELSLPGLVVRADRPALPCLASQYAGWAIQAGAYFAMGSGPLRAVARVERELFEKLGYAESADASARSVLVLETRELPGEDVVEWVSERSGVLPDRLAFVVAPTASLAGGVQISARVLETGLHKMEKLGFDVTRVRSGFGSVPLAPVAKNDLRAIGRTNDCILYGGRAAYAVTGDDAELEDLVQRVPSSASSDYGTPFYEIFKRYGGDFYKIDPLLFSPAEVALTNLASGRTFRAGAMNVGVLESSLFG
ncbi:MAG: methenyltetrahydromethanopterin cyclohydrolase [Gemmatimonadetes bacterium]|nr:methenyltetrahydromethanopterin cyclohydrolase [Gemmatimonadota bacterium]